MWSIKWHQCSHVGCKLGNISETMQDGDVIVITDY